MSQQFADRLFVDCAVLAHVQWCQMEAEYFGCAAQVSQSSACQIHRAVAEQGLDQHIQVGDKLLRRGIGFRLFIHRRQMGDFVAEFCGCRRQARIDQYQRAAVGFVAAADGLIRGRVGKFAQFIAYICQTICQGKTLAEDMRLVQVMFERQFGMLLHRILHDIVRDKRIAVAVAADPAAYAQQRRHLDILVETRAQLFFQIGVNLGDFVQEGVAIKFQAVPDLIAHGQLGGAQHACLPQDQNEAAQGILVFGEFIRRHVQTVAVGQQAGDDQVAVEGAFALHFGGVCGQHRRDQRIVQECL